MNNQLEDLAQQAQEMQERMQEMQAKLQAAEVEGVSGDGLVKVVLNGKGEMRRVVLGRSVVHPEDIAMFQDLIVAAHADARHKVEANHTAEMQKLTAGLRPPPGCKLPF
jgi:nucleoid-associated protein EbfC